MENIQESPTSTEKGYISHLRDGIDIVRMVLFLKLKKRLKKRFQAKKGKEFVMLLSGAVVNELFGLHNPKEPFATFSKENKKLIQDELSKIPKTFPELLIPITDSLRMHFFCNHAEGMPDLSATTLERARNLGILLEDRPTPLPKNFMELVYKIGESYGLITTQEKSKENGNG